MQVRYALIKAKRKVFFQNLRILSAYFFVLALIFLAPVLYAGNYPSQFPANLFDAPAYPGPYPQQDQLLPPNGVLSTWNDLCGSKIQISFSNMGEGYWVKEGPTTMTITTVDQINPTGDAFLNCAARNQNPFFMRYRYFTGADFDAPTGLEFYPGAKGWFNPRVTLGSSTQTVQLFNDFAIYDTDGRPADSFAVKISMAPLAGTGQEIRIRMDKSFPMVNQAAAPDGTEEIVVGSYRQEPGATPVPLNWIRKTPSASPWYNKLDLRKPVPANITAEIYDPQNYNLSPASGIWQVRASFDRLATSGTSDYLVIDKCNAVNASGTDKIHFPSSYSATANALVGACSATAFPEKALAREASADSYLKVQYDLDWGNPAASFTNGVGCSETDLFTNGSATANKNLGSFCDGDHTASLYMRDMAGNAASSYYAFRTDNHGPCEAGYHICSVALSGATGSATNSLNWSILLSVQDGTGSGVKTSGPAMQLAWKSFGLVDPDSAAAAADQHKYWVQFNSTFDAGIDWIDSTSAATPATMGNTETVNYNSSYSISLPDGQGGGLPSGPAWAAAPAIKVDDGYYVVCARFLDNANNVTGRHLGAATLSSDQEILGNKTWNAIEKFGWQSDIASMSSAKNCTKIILDRTAPNGPNELYLSRGSGAGLVNVSGPYMPDPPNANGLLFHQNNPPLDAGVNLLPASHDLIPWTNVASFRARFTVPVESPVLSTISKGRYKISSNYQNTLLPGDLPPSGMFTHGNDGTQVNLQTEASLGPEGRYMSIAYDPATLPDGCKNVYVWLEDDAGNKATMVGADQTLRYNAGLFCYDGTKPNAVTSNFGTANSAPLKFYSTTKMTEYLALDTSANKKFNPNTAGNSDLSVNVRNVPITNGKTLAGADDSITVAWLPVTDPTGPTGGYASGLVNNGYRLCWSTIAGNCDTSVDLSDPYTQNGGGSGTVYQVYTLTGTQMNALRAVPNIYYFYVEVRDKAGNVSDKSPLQQIIIDNAEPCWTGAGMACSLSLNNGIGSIDMTNPIDGLVFTLGMEKRIEANPVIKYLLCGDNSNEKCDLPFNAPGFVGGLVMNFAVSATDGANGSNFGIATGSPGDVKFGIGIDVWNADSSDETTFWFDERLPIAPATAPSLDIPKPLGSGNVSFNMHLFRGKTGLTYNDYVANPPKYEVDDPNCNIDNNVCNITPLKLTETDGLEVVRNVYLRVRDIAGNWSPNVGHPTEPRLVYQTFVVDTRPPGRITQSLTGPELWQSGSFFMAFREQAGNIEYSADNVAWDSNISTRPATNNASFVLKYTHPVDLSGIEGISYKFDSAPGGAGHADPMAIFTGTTAGQLALNAPHNYPRVYVWLKDKSKNPDTVAVPGIASYYSHVNNAAQPCHDAGSGVVNFTGAQSTCRVVSFELPYDGTKPNATASLPYLLVPGPASESTYISQPTINFAGSSDNAHARESGLRTTCLGPGTTNCTYQICYDTTVGGCANSVWANDPTGTNPLMTFTPTAPLPDGNWYFAVRAYDKAGNASESSPGKQILIDTAAPCTAANGDTCLLTLAGGAFSTASQNISINAQGTDKGAGVNAVTIGEYYQVGATCYAQFYTTLGTMSAPVVQACSGSLDFSLTRGGTPTVPNAVIPVALLNGPTNIFNYQLSGSDAIKTISASFRDAAQQWSVPVDSTITFDSGPPPAVTAATVVPSGWSSSDTFLVNLTFPTSDFSSQGAPSYGIGAVWTKLGALPTSDSDGIRTPLASLLYNSGTGQYGVPVQSVVTGARDVYIWLEDVLGNKSMLNRVRVTVMYDGVRPSVPQSVSIDPTSSSLQPVVSWQASSDTGSGLAASNTYRVCWDTVLGGCANSAFTTSTSYALSVAQTLTQNTWYFSVYSQDQVLLQSFESTPVTHVVGSNTPVIDYLGVGNFSGTAVSPGGGPEGDYTFALIYSDPSNQIPAQTSVQIDLDGNGIFESGESFVMTRTGSGVYNDSIYTNGEQFMATVPLTFPRYSNGQIRYRFNFASPSVSAQAGTTGLSNSTDYFLTISNFKTEFDGVVQVRNNVQRPGGNRGVLILFKTPAEPGTEVFMQIISRNGFLIKRVIERQAYSALGKNYIYWDTDSENGEKVGSGVYFAVIEIGADKYTKPIAVIR